MSLLTLIQGVCNSPGIGVSAPDAVVNSTDQGVKSLLELAQQEGVELAKRHDWPRLMAEKTFTTVATSVQTDAIPDDFDRFINGSMFNRTTARMVFGPLSPQDWQREQANPSVGTANDWFRIRGADLLITPTPAAGETVAYEYVSLNWCQASGGTGQAAWAADADIALLPEKLMKLGIIWRWKKSKGLDYAEDFRSYEMEVDQAAGRAGGAPVLMLNSRPFRRFSTNVPDGNFPSS